MGYLADIPPATLPVPGPDGKPDPSGATVTFRGAATFDDELALLRATRHLAELPDDDERSHAFRVARALLMVEGWTFHDRQGELLPRTAEVLRARLNQRVAKWIEAEANRRYEGGREEQDEAPFDSRSPEPSEART